MRNRHTARTFALGIIAGVAGVVGLLACTSPPPVTLRPVLLDQEYAGEGFTFRPPRDWRVTVRDGGDVFVAPPDLDQQAFKARAQIVVRYERRDLSGLSAEKFHDLMVSTLGEREETIGVLEATDHADASPPYSSVELLRDAPRGKAYHRFQAYRDGDRGYWLIVASAYETGWKPLAPLLRASLATFRLGSGGDDDTPETSPTAP